MGILEQWKLDKKKLCGNHAYSG